MFRAINECNNLKKEYEIENNFKYDVVVRIRPDIFLEKINIFKTKKM